jgi:hypothetical protein
MSSNPFLTNKCMIDDGLSTLIFSNKEVIKTASPKKAD